MEQERLGVLHTGGGDTGNQWAVEGGCKNVKTGGRVEVGEEWRGTGGTTGGSRGDWGTEGHKRPGQVGDGGNPREGRRRVLKAGPSLGPAPRLQPLSLQCEPSSAPEILA